MSIRRRPSGMSLLEVVLFIIVIGIGVAGFVTLFNQLTLAGADAVTRKQALAIASSLLEEIELHAFTYCEPDDANGDVYTASGPGACTVAEGLGPETDSGVLETRYAEPRFDNVNDYSGFSMSGILDITGTAVTGLESYSASVTIADAGSDFPSGDATIAVAASDAERITVTVNGPGNVTVSLQGYRLRYAPNSP